MPTPGKRDLLAKEGEGVGGQKRPAPLWASRGAPRRQQEGGGTAESLQPRILESPEFGVGIVGLLGAPLGADLSLSPPPEPSCLLTSPRKRGHPPARALTFTGTREEVGKAQRVTRDLH